ncbi:hypothetical protein Nepgr_022101 [Nepenthes gracilis]|uniref:Cystatin domain-containing protein n=1 Tax=Nepenthes gracilis TaxID=150966 RepID=A0AAD3SZW7_NEPGR|nr:hypothetical protein Nepgr_022101 [Nepenthes gracilis]
MQRAMVLPILLIAVISIVSAATEVSAERGKVGGWTKIRDVKGNEEIQELGRFSVEQFNKSHQEGRRSHLHGHRGGIRGLLEFEEVVAAEKQVVSGIKYYLEVNAKQGGVTKTFDAVVVVKAWLRSRELLSFAPSPK